jgi:hypothetical protein
MGDLFLSVQRHAVRPRSSVCPSRSADVIYRPLRSEQAAATIFAPLSLPSLPPLEPDAYVTRLDSFGRFINHLFNYLRLAVPCRTFVAARRARSNYRSAE